MGLQTNRRMRGAGRTFGGLCCLIAGLAAATHAAAEPFISLAERADTLLQQIDGNALATSPGGQQQTLAGIRLKIENCSGYPYHQSRQAPAAVSELLDDLRSGLATGLQCLAGSGPMGRLHPYHEYQAHRLLSLFEDDRPKTLQCVADQMFATAVATSPGGTRHDDPLARQLSRVEHPGIVLDTYRLGGLLSRTHDDETFRNFFGLTDAQIYEHRNGQPMRPPSLHRFENRPALLFHELVHWLGHQHSAIYPDLAHLYETCCFGGSDYIDDPQRNHDYQQAACRILRDDDLWSQAHSPYKQMRIWHFKEYDRLKPQMRADYDA